MKKRKLIIFSTCFFAVPYILSNTAKYLFLWITHEALTKVAITEQKALTLLNTSTGFLTQESEKYRPRDNAMQSVSYPKPGDIPTLNRKVFKAQRVTIREHPYISSVRRLCSHYVTGALMSRTVVLTVAHPLHNVPVPELGVVLGENYSDRGSMLYTVILVIIHPDFDQYTLENDIAMLKIYEYVTYKMNIKSILLRDASTNITGMMAFVTGWGRCDNMGTELCLDRTSKYYPYERMDPMLRTVSFTIPAINHYCEGYKRHDVTLRPGMMCAGVAREEDPVVSCLAVPGAPLVVGAQLVGLLSWGFGCGYSYDMPLVYSNISHYIPWIAHNNKVMHNLKQINFTVLFKATKAAVLSQWIMEARDIKPNFRIRTDKSMEPLPIDYELFKVRGTIKDARDFVSDGIYSEEKRNMYESLRNDFAKSQLSERTTKTRKTTRGRPFLSNDTRREAVL